MILKLQNKFAFPAILFLLLMLNSRFILGQEKHPVFIGVQPSITKETFYEKEDFDINIVPLVFQTPIGKIIDIRFTTLANYHFGSSEGFSDIGFQLIAPIYFKKKEKIKMPSHGFYIGPLIGFSRNLLYNHYTTTPAIEPGYLFKTSNRFSLSLGIQLGASHFNYDNEPNKWVSHFGFKINLGFWVNKGK